MRAVERRFRAMGTSMTLLLHARASVAEAALAAAESRIRALEERFTRFEPTSELCRLNARAGERVAVSREMREVLALSFELHAETEGLFDPAILPALERAGYDTAFERLAPRASLGRMPPSRARFAAIELDGDSARLPSDMRIDLGGVVKGWAADRVADELAAFGPALVDLGGDVALRGEPPEGRWLVGVERPGGGPAPLTVLALGDGGVATSGTARRRWRVGGRWMHHLVDPRTGEPADTDLVQVVALHAKTAWAEAWAKTALVLGRADAQALAARRGLELLLVPGEGEPTATAGIVAAINDVASVA